MLLLGQGGGHVVVVVVVAEDREHAVRRRQAAERFGGGADEPTVAPGDVVAAEHDQVGPRGHRQGHGASDIVGAHPAASVHVGDESDAEAREFRRQSVHRNVHVATARAPRVRTGIRTQRHQ